MKSSQLAIVTLLLVQTAAAQRSSAPAGGDWPMYRHDYAGTGASAVAEINAGNVAKLTRVWTYALQGESGPPPNSEVTPIVVNGVMYLPASGRVVALDPEKGTELWRYSVSGGAPSRRGVAYWPGDGALPPRIIFTAAGRDRQPARVRRAQRREAVGVQLGRAAGGSRARHVGRRQLEGAARRERLAVLLHRRRAARPAVRAAGVTDSGRLRRRPQGRES